MPTIVNTIFPVTQIPGTAPNTIAPPSSPGGGANNEHPVGVEANLAAPGGGVPTSSPSKEKASSNPSPNPTYAQTTSPGAGVTDDSPNDNSDQNSPDGPVRATEVGVSLGRVDGGTFLPNGAPVNVFDNRIALQTFSSGQGIPTFVNGGARW